MQFFKVRVDGSFDLDEEIRHIKFKDVPVNGSSGKESDLENLIVKYPGLLNTSDFRMGASGDADLLIISQQPLTLNRKRADLFAIDRDGNLVIIEIKRDAVDEKTAWKAWSSRQFGMPRQAAK
jgi:RecB family endonuclease NucS